MTNTNNWVFEGLDDQSSSKMFNPSIYIFGRLTYITFIYLRYITKSKQPHKNLTNSAREKGRNTHILLYSLQLGIMYMDVKLNFFELKIWM